MNEDLVGLMASTAGADRRLEVVGADGRLEIVDADGRLEMAGRASRNTLLFRLRASWAELQPKNEFDLG